MASSVSSERVLSQRAITNLKPRNGLKSDIVEALHCVKCSIRPDLLFREPAPSSALEVELNSMDESEDEWEDVEEAQWVENLLDEDEDDKMVDDESD
jgi:hypothetical protein